MVWMVKFWSWLLFNFMLERKIFVGVEVLFLFVGFVFGLFWRIYCFFGNFDDVSIWGCRSGFRICFKGIFWVLCFEYYGWRVFWLNFYFYVLCCCVRIFLYFSFSVCDFFFCLDYFFFISNLVLICFRGVDYLVVVFYLGYNLWDDFFEFVLYYCEKVFFVVCYIYYYVCVYIRDCWYFDCGFDWLVYWIFVFWVLYLLFWK